MWTRDEGCGMWNAECGMRNAGCGVENGVLESN